MNVPALRFKEFNEEWSIKKLSDIVEKIGDGIHSTPIYDDNGQYYFVNGNNLTNNKIEISENTKKVNANEYLKHKIVLTTQTVLMSINGTIGNLAFYNDEKVVLGKSACYINLKENENKYFVFNLFQTSNITSYFDKELTGSTIKNLSLTTIKNTKAFFPSYQEQAKIANFLMAVDEKISLLTQKYNLLAQYKKSVMQKIFSQELRFKDDDGRNFPEWEFHEIGKFLVKHDEKSTKNNQYPVLTSSRRGIFLQKDYFNGNDVASKDNTGYNVVPRNYFTYRHMSDDLIFAFNRNNIVDRGIVSTLYPVFTTRNIDDDFLEIVLNNGSEFKEFAIQQKQGGSRTYMYFTKLIRLEINLPCKTEQTKIANFLTALDDKITTTQAQLDATKQYKQGLLQQMFV